MQDTDPAQQMRDLMKEAKEVFKVSSAQIARHAEMSPQNLHQWASGKLTNPTSKTIARIVKATERAIHEKYRESVHIAYFYERRRTHHGFDRAMLEESVATPPGEE